MVGTTKYLLLAGIFPAIAFSAALALADDHGSTTAGDGRGGMMGSGMMGGDSRGRMTGHGMESCMQMQSAMHGGSERPNEQWRRR